MLSSGWCALGIASRRKQGQEWSARTWLSFTAQRNYGDLSQDLLQIWIAGFDAEKARQGEDPSWSAFWWPDQDAGEENHLPFWLE